MHVDQSMSEESELKSLISIDPHLLHKERVLFQKRYDHEMPRYNAPPPLACHMELLHRCGSSAIAVPLLCVFQQGPAEG